MLPLCEAVCSVCVVGGVMWCGGVCVWWVVCGVRGCVVWG